VAKRNPHLEDYIIEPLGSHHNREAFSCGKEALDRYLKEQARQDIKKHAAVVFVMRPKDANHLAGYYTLSSMAVALDELPKDMAKRLPRYPAVPTTLLGRLAVDKNFHGSGLGERLLMDALHRSLQQSSKIASAAVIVDAKDSKGCEFYKRYQFIAFPDRALRLFLPMATIEKMFSR
jgi:predicted GNAT family N-acyltransferase